MIRRANRARPMSETAMAQKPAVCRDRPGSEETTLDGFVIIAVLWVLGAMSVLASVYASYVITTAAGVRNYDENLQSETLVSAALELTAFHELSAPKQDRSTYGHFSFELGQAVVSVKYRSEATRIDLNAASKNLLAGLFMALGAGKDDADQYANRVIEWRTPPRHQRSDHSFTNPAIDYPRRRGKFPHPAELARVRDLPPDLVRRALPLVTVYSGIAKVNILDAAPQVIAALPGMNSDRLNAILAAQQNGRLDAQNLTELLGPSRGFVTTQAGRTFRVTVNMSFQDGRRISSEAVILLFSNGPEPFSVLSWRDNVDGTITQ